jgi:signal transduction histidine kinase
MFGCTYGEPVHLEADEPFSGRRLESRRKRGRGASDDADRGPAGGGRGETSNGSATVRVSDNGPGIDSGCEKIFTPFSR